MSAEKPLSTDDLVELGYTSDVAAQARNEIISLRARNRKLVEACRKAREWFDAANYGAGSADVYRSLRAAIEENADGSQRRL
jgi:hypothetical protein